jgi:hypothetical protein
MLTKLLIENEDPKLAQSKTLVFPTPVVRLKIDVLLPILAVARRDTMLPNVPWQRIVMKEPRRATDRNERQDPTLTESKTDKLAPALIDFNTLTLDPTLAEQRSDIDDPKTT